MIIDFHTHCFSPDVIASRDTYIKDPHFGMLNGRADSPLADHEGLLRMCENSGIDYAVAMGFPWFDPEVCTMQNSYFSRLKELTSGRILGFGSVPLNARRDVDAWIRQIKELGLAGIGEAAFYRHGMTDENYIFLRDLFTGAQKYSLPLCIHVNEPVGHEYTGKYEPSLSRLYNLIKEFQDVVTVLSHWGGGLFVYELMPEVEESFRNVYYDTAATPYLYKNTIYKSACDIVGAERILFGSDYPLISPDRYISAIRETVQETSDFSSILGANAARILKI